MLYGVRPRLKSVINLPTQQTTNSILFATNCKVVPFATSWIAELNTVHSFGPSDARNLQTSNLTFFSHSFLPTSLNLTYNDVLQQSDRIPYLPQQNNKHSNLAYHRGRHIYAPASQAIIESNFRGEITSCHLFSLSLAALAQNFLAANSQCWWNPSLIAATRSLKYVGHIAPGMLLVTAEPCALELLRNAYSRSVLKPPSTYSITFVGKFRKCLLRQGKCLEGVSWRSGVASSVVNRRLVKTTTRSTSSLALHTSIQSRFLHARGALVITESPPRRREGERHLVSGEVVSPLGWTNSGDSSQTEKEFWEPKRCLVGGLEWKSSCNLMPLDVHRHWNWIRVICSCLKSCGQTIK